MDLSQFDDDEEWIPSIPAEPSSGEFVCKIW